MKRDGFLKSFGLATSGLFLPVGLLKDKPIKIYDNYVRGLMHYEYKKIKDRIKEGDEIILKLEPNNVYDTFAIQLFWQHYKLGYVAAYENIVLSNMLANGGELKACVSHNNYKFSLEKALSVEIFANLIIADSTNNANSNIRADDKDGLYRVCP